MIRVLKEDDRGINFFSELLACNSYAARVFQCAKKKNLLVIQNSDAGGTSVNLDHESRPPGIGGTQRGQHRRKDDSGAVPSLLKGSLVVFDDAVQRDRGNYPHTLSGRL